MAEANPTGDPDVNPNGSDDSQGNPLDTNPNGSGQPIESNDPLRKLQSERDKERAKREELEARLEALEGVQGEQARDDAAKAFLAENKDKYGDVDVTDLAFATKPEDFETLAQKAQDRLDRVKNKALEDVHKPQDVSLSEEDADKELKKLEKEPEPGAFGKFLSIRSRTRK